MRRPDSNLFGAACGLCDHALALYAMGRDEEARDRAERAVAALDQHIDGQREAPLRPDDEAVARGQRHWAGWLANGDWRVDDLRWAVRWWHESGLDACQPEADPPREVLRLLAAGLPEEAAATMARVDLKQLEDWYSLVGYWPRPHAHPRVDLVCQAELGLPRARKPARRAMEIWPGYCSRWDHRTHWHGWDVLSYAMIYQRRYGGLTKPGEVIRSVRGF